MAGYFGIESTYNKARNKYFWPQIYKTIKEYIQMCDVCIDIVGPFKDITETGNCYIVVAMEYLTKWPEARLIPNMMVPTIARFIYEDIIYHHDALYKIMTTHHRLAAAYHSQINGLTERFNKTLCSTLAKLVSDYKTTWDTLLLAALFAYRIFLNYTTKYDLFYLMHGYTATLPLDLQLQPEEDISELPLEQSLELHINTIAPTENSSPKKNRKALTSSTTMELWEYTSYERKM
ncbi:16655_t:CDS:2, partial [Dentiscutata erythropus]